MWSCKAAEKGDFHELASFAIPSLQQVIKMIMEAYYEPQFSNHSHGFSPRRGCHTALREITQKGRGSKVRTQKVMAGQLRPGNVDGRWQQDL